MTHRTNPHPIPHALLTVKDVLQARGVRTSKHYDDIKGGLYTPPVKQGRSSVWPINEVDALNRAVIAGKSDIENPLQDSATPPAQDTDEQRHEDAPAATPTTETPAIEPSTTKVGNPKSGYSGVSWHKAGGKWQAQVRENGKPKSVGTFKTPEEANAARLAYLAKKGAK